MHPDRFDVVEHIASVHGFRLQAYRARPVKTPELPGYLPQFRWREALAGHLNGPIYAVRPRAILRAGYIKTAAEVREFLGLRPGQLLVLILFDEDELLERFYDPAVAKELAVAGYDVIVSASYSVWWPRPRMHQLYNMSRSLALCIALQQLGAPAVPRVDWVFYRDVERWCKWINENPCVETVAVDAQTSRGSGDSWEQLLTGLEQFDKGTGKRLRYLINGPTRETRWAEIYNVLSPDRVTLTDAELHLSDPPTTQEQLEFARPSDGKIDWGLCYPARVRAREIRIAAAREQAGLDLAA